MNAAAGRHRLTSPPARVTSVDATPLGSSLAASERRAIVLGTVFRIVGTPLVALAGLVNTAFIVRQTGIEVFGLVSLVSTLSLLLPFADLGIGATITTACSRSPNVAGDVVAVATVQRGFRVLARVAVAMAAFAIAIMATDSWSALLGSSSGPTDRIAITVSFCLIALGVPAGMGVRILVGIDRNPLAVLLTMTNAAFTLGITLTLVALGANGIWYAIAGAGGVLIGNCLATAVALRISGLGKRAFGRPAAVQARSRLLKGSSWMFVVSVGLPVGLQSHRLILSHVAPPEELSRYALMAQIYGLGWMVFSTAGMALWPVFVKRRDDTRASTSLWLRSMAAFFALALVAGAVMTALGPWATSLLSGGRVVASTTLAATFALLLVVQCVHLPAGMLLTMPKEARWQALCIVVMGLTSVGLGVWWGSSYGGPGVVAAAAIAVTVAQVVPDLAWVRRLLARRPRELAAATAATGRPTD